MICVTIGRTRHKMIMAEHVALAKDGAELVELRLDWITKEPVLSRLIANRPTPVIVTCRRPADGGRFSGSEEKRITLLREAIVSGVEYVDLEDDIAGKIPRYGKTKRIVSYHNFNETPYELPEIHERLCKLDPDMIKIVTTANSPLDNVRMLDLVKHANVPTIGFCMGDYGVVSRVLCGKFGSPITYATFSEERALAPGQLSFEKMKNLYNYNSINAQTKVYGVLGDPIGHSWSPLLFNTAFKKMGMNAVYLPMRVPSEEFEETIQAYDALDVQGYSVTIPHKSAAMKVVKLVEEATKEIGAANTLFKDEEGRWCAMNTDYSAAMDAIKLAVKEKGERQLAGLRVLMLGSGGVARAIGLGVTKAGCALTISNRTKKHGEKLAAELNCQHATWGNRGSVSCDIIINCTPVGMSPNMNDTPYEQHWFRDGTIVFDTIYNPENTLFIKQAREHRCIVVSGVEMFVRQAAMQFKRFTGERASLDDFKQTLRTGMSPIRVKPSSDQISEEDE